MSETSISAQAAIGRMDWTRKWAKGVLLCALLTLAYPATSQSPIEALFQAVELNDIEATEAAITAGADLSAKNANGMTPADVAVDLGHFRIAHMLLARRTAATKQQPAAPRVTDKGKATLNAPRARLAAPRPLAQPNPKLADIIPPKKPDPAPMASATPPTAVPAPTPAPTPASDGLLESLPGIDEQPAITAPSVPAADQTVSEPRPDDEIAKTAPPKEATRMAEAKPEEPGLFDNIWGGVKNVVTLGGLLGGSDPDTGRSPISEQAGLSSPADRFGRKTRESDSAAGRMVDRMTNMIGEETVPENEFGLPSQPVVEAPTSHAAPSLEAPTL